MKTLRSKLLCAICLLLGLPMQAQMSYMCRKDVAVFYPADFESKRLMPSMIFTNELAPLSQVPQSWDIRPVFRTLGHKKSITLHVGKDADLYGNGEVIGNLRRNGTEFTTWNTDNYGFGKFEGKQLYQSHPYVMGVRKDGSSFAVIVDDTWRLKFTLGDSIQVETSGPMPRVVVIQKNTPQEIMQELAELTGKMEMPPLWALGYQQCKFSYYPEANVRKLAQDMRANRIPCDVIWLDIDYMDGFRVFTIDKNKFPDPKGMNDYLHGLNFKTVYMIDPGVKAEKGYAVYDEGKKRDIFIKDSLNREYTGRVWPGDCVFPDFTDQATQLWWSSLYKDFMANGIDGIWNDMNEPAVFDTPEMTMPESNRHKGSDRLPADIHARYHNAYGMLMVKSSRQGILDANPDRRPFVLSRANILGGQRYGATWTGDNASTWSYLRASIPMTINLGLSAQPFNGPDACGFSQNCTAELLEHWMALGTFYPFYRNHNSSKEQDQEPWSFGKKSTEIARTAVNRRYMLMPYIYTLFEEAAKTGMPIMRPLFMADIKDTTLRQEQECFTLGAELMVIPRWSSQPALPQGGWKIFSLEGKDDGVQPYMALRQGAILPLGGLIQSTADYSADSITLLINPDAQMAATGRLYDDKGEGFGYKEGDYSISRFTASKADEKNIRIRAERTAGTRESARNYRIGFVTSKKVIYTGWHKSDDFTVAVPQEVLKDLKTYKGIELKKLKFTDFGFAKHKSLHDMLSHDKIQAGEGDDF